MTDFSFASERNYNPARHR